MSTAIGNLRQRITLQTLTRTDDGQGGFVSTWTDYATLWAKVETWKSWEKNIADQVKSWSTYKITIRYYPKLKSEMQIKFGDRLFQIKGINKVNEENFFMEIHAEENGEGT